MFATEAYTGGMLADFCYVCARSPASFLQSVDCADEALAQQVQGVVRRLHTALHPCKAASKSEITEVKVE